MVRFYTVKNGGKQRAAPMAIGYKMWNAETEEWDDYNSLGKLIENKDKNIKDE